MLLPTSEQDPCPFEVRYKQIVTAQTLGSCWNRLHLILKKPLSLHLWTINKQSNGTNGISPLRIKHSTWKRSLPRLPLLSWLLTNLAKTDVAFGLTTSRNNIIFFNFIWWSAITTKLPKMYRLACLYILKLPVN